MIEVWRAACRLIDEFGSKAGVVAVLRSDQLGVAGDTLGQEVWLKVLAALDEFDRGGCEHDLRH